MKAGDGRFQLGRRDAETAGHCRACHSPAGDTTLLSPGHRAAAEPFHAGDPEWLSLSPSEACLRCHGTGASTSSGAPVFHAAASHPYGIAPTGGTAGGYPVRAVTDSRLPLFDGRIECATCHVLASASAYLLPPTHDAVSLCLGCHERSPALAGRASYASMAGGLVSGWSGR